MTDLSKSASSDILQSALQSIHLIGSSLLVRYYRAYCMILEDDVDDIIMWAVTLKILTPTQAQIEGLQGFLSTFQGPKLYSKPYGF